MHASPKSYPSFDILSPYKSIFSFLMMMMMMMPIGKVRMGPYLQSRPPLPSQAFSLPISLPTQGNKVIIEQIVGEKLDDLT